MVDLRKTKICIKFRFNHKKKISEPYDMPNRAFGGDLMIRTLTVELCLL